MRTIKSPAPLPAPDKIYSTPQAAEFLGVSERTLFRYLSERDKNNNFKDPYLQKINPQPGLGGQWQFVGANILSALGSVTYNSQAQVKITGTGEPTVQAIHQ